MPTSKYINTITCGDATKHIQNIDDSSIDLIVTDPPYGIDLHCQRRNQTQLWDRFHDTKILLTAIVPELYRVLKNNSVMFMFASWKQNWLKAILEKNFIVKSCIVWVKNNWGLGYYTRPQHEFIWMCFKGTPKRFPKAVSDVWHFDRLINPEHPCEKPLKLIHQCVYLASSIDDVVLDPFVGSGTTPLACKMLKRKYIGFELSPKYCKMTNNRLIKIPKNRLEDYTL